MDLTFQVPMQYFSLHRKDCVLSHVQLFCDPMNSMKRQNNRILKEELPRPVGAQYATGDQWRNNSRKNEGMEPKQKQYPAVDVTENAQGPML